eukprot:Amastigsp_a3192_4.p2 type:complete len:142 gc:universal Amastigsp_a3192_4:999-574(-)
MARHSAGACAHAPDWGCAAAARQLTRGRWTNRAHEIESARGDGCPAAYTCPSTTSESKRVPAAMASQARLRDHAASATMSPQRRRWRTLQPSSMICGACVNLRTTTTPPRRLATSSTTPRSQQTTAATTTTTTTSSSVSRR